MICPWDGWEVASVSFCEARICASVVEPSNAYSSFAYVALGAWLLTRREARGAWLLSSVAIANVMIGLGSFAFHATGTFVGELIDLFGMFLLSGLILAFSIASERKWAPSKLLTAWAFFVLSPMLLVLVIKPAGIPLFALQVVTGVGLEVRAKLQGRSPNFRLFAQALGLVCLAFAIWVTDTAKILCVPDNHLVTGHAVWHVLNAFAISRLFFFYAAGLNALPLPAERGEGQG